MKEKHLSLRIEDDLLLKFRYVCSAEDRSANYVLLRLVRQQIQHYEKKNGPITEDDLTEFAEKLKKRKGA